ncbi:MAG: acyl carrier protein [Rubrivivax sp.]
MGNPEKLVRCFATALAVPESAVVDTLSYESIPQWDSVAHMALVTELEAEFDVMLDTDEILALSSPVQARAILGRHGVEF